MRIFKERYADRQVIDLQGVPVRLRVSERARRVSLRVDRASGEAIAVAPCRAALPEAARFALERRGWLLAQLRALPAPPAPLAAGGSIEVLGQTWRLRPDGRRPRLGDPDGGDRVLAGCGLAEVDPGLVARVVRREALASFVAQTGAFCTRLGVAEPSVRLIDARTRWGSCTPPYRGHRGSIRLSWRLALAPPAVAAYVVAHECAHLIEGNHGPRFWALVRQLIGDPAPHRAWLRAQGPSLLGLLSPLG